ncbi:MAG: hypothetical protein HC900_11720 [Methylacidiphilales bacterium]|nr:hypothetical protein [Candidatus Methylacidiphilales bacterium]
MTAQSEFPSVRATDERENVGVNTSEREPFCALLAARSVVEADASENRGVNPSRAPSIGDLIACAASGGPR